MTARPEIPMEDQEFWRKVLTEGHGPQLVAHRLFRRLPGPPRCKVCYVPFGGLAGKLAGLMGYPVAQESEYMRRLL
jgi:adenylate cyclase